MQVLDRSIASVTNMKHINNCTLVEVVATYGLRSTEEHLFTNEDVCWCEIRVGMKTHDEEGAPCAHSKETSTEIVILVCRQ
jgi:hypothetical protein